MSRNRLGEEVPPRSLDYERWSSKSTKSFRPTPHMRNVRSQRLRAERQDPVRLFEVRLEKLISLEAEHDLGVDGALDRLLDYGSRCEVWAMETFGCTWDDLVEDYDSK